MDFELNLLRKLFHCQVQLKQGGSHGHIFVLATSIIILQV